MAPKGLMRTLTANPATKLPALLSLTRAEKFKSDRSVISRRL
jgi:hypothetical protein